MKHSVSEIAKCYSNLSKLRRDKKEFNESDFIRFAKLNSTKYDLIEIDGKLYVSGWYSDKLIDDYKRTIK